MPPHTVARNKRIAQLLSRRIPRGVDHIIADYAALDDRERLAHMFSRIKRHQLYIATGRHRCGIRIKWRAPSEKRPPADIIGHYMMKQYYVARVCSPNTARRWRNGGYVTIGDLVPGDDDSALWMALMSAAERRWFPIAHTHIRAWHRPGYVTAMTKRLARTPAI